jgi:hypothetical protein
MKIRKIKRKNRKYFGQPNEKWAKGGGKHGYGRFYGRVRTGGQDIDHRTKAEIQNDFDRLNLCSITKSNFNEVSVPNGNENVLK